jgi:hypothetical protein
MSTPVSSAARAFHHRQQAANATATAATATAPPTTTMSADAKDLNKFLVMNRLGQYAGKLQDELRISSLKVCNKVAPAKGGSGAGCAARLWLRWLTRCDDDGCQPFVTLRL